MRSIRIALNPNCAQSQYSELVDRIQRGDPRRMTRGIVDITAIDAFVQQKGKTRHPRHYKKALSGPFMIDQRDGPYSDRGEFA